MPSKPTGEAGAPGRGPQADTGPLCPLGQGAASLQGLPPPGTSLLCRPHRITATVACDMDLAKYPMDEQECTLHLESCECRRLPGSACVSGTLLWAGRGSGWLGPPCAAGLAQGQGVTGTGIQGA